MLFRLDGFVDSLETELKILLLVYRLLTLAHRALVLALLATKVPVQLALKLLNLSLFALLGLLYLHASAEH